MAKSARKAAKSRTTRKAKAKKLKTKVRKNKRSRKPTKKTSAKKPASRARKATRKAKPQTSHAAEGTFSLETTALAMSATTAAITCVNAYLDEHRPGWNGNGNGNSRTLGELHLDVPLFLDAVRHCMEPKGFTFNVTAVVPKVMAGNVSLAKQEIILGAKHI